VLPQNLIPLHSRKGKLFITFQEDATLFNEMQKILIDNIGNKKKEIEKKFIEVEESSKNYKIAKAIKQYLLSSAIFKMDSPIDPVIIRKAVFEEAPDGALNDNERQKVFQKVSVKFYIEPEKIEQYLYSDIENNYLLIGYEPLPTEELVKKFNNYLLNSILFRANDIKITLPENMVELCTIIAQQKVMYKMVLDNGFISINLKAPSSIRHNQERYAIALGNAISNIVTTSKWTLESEIFLGNSKKKKRLFFSINENTSKFFIKSNFETYPSNPQLIKDLRNFYNLNIIANNNPLVIENNIFVPDLAILNNEKIAYLEFLKFWDQSYIKEKEGILAPHKIVYITIPLKEGNCGDIEYDTIDPKSINANIIAMMLKKKGFLQTHSESKIIVEEKPPELNNILSIGIVQSKYVEKSEIKKQLLEHGFIKKGMFYIDPSHEKEYTKKIESLMPNYSMIISFLESIHVDPEPFLNMIGYKIIWRSFSKDDIIIRKI
jgi:predicted nuclease of restriction endonuclease-like RecB superfamily